MEIISIHMSSGLSGTYNTAYQASEMVDANVTVIDSKSISNGLAYQIKHIVELIEQGTSTTDIVKSVNARTQNTSINYLKKEISEFIENHKIKSVGITHASALDFVDKIKNTFTEAFNCQDYDINITTPVVTTHTGKGAIGLVVVREK